MNIFKRAWNWITRKENDEALIDEILEFHNDFQRRKEERKNNLKIDRDPVSIIQELNRRDREKHEMGMRRDALTKAYWDETRRYCEMYSEDIRSELWLKLDDYTRELAKEDDRYIADKKS